MKALQPSCDAVFRNLFLLGVVSELCNSKSKRVTTLKLAHSEHTLYTIDLLKLDVKFSNIVVTAQFLPGILDANLCKNSTNFERRLYY